jgi:hypothetical protein
MTVGSSSLSVISPLLLLRAVPPICIFGERGGRLVVTVPIRSIWAGAPTGSGGPAAVMDLPGVQASACLEAIVPLGGAELPGRLRQRTHGAVPRPAGCTALVDADIPRTPGWEW